MRIATVGITGIEPFRADLIGSSPPATPLGERQLQAHGIVQGRHVALGRTARALGADALLATLSGGDVSVLASIVDDRDAIELLLLGRTDFAITGVPLSARDRQAGLRDTLLGVELFAVVVAGESTLHGLRAEVARRVLNGAVRDRSEIGLPPGPILLGVPAERDLRDRAARALIAGDSFAATATPIDGDRGAFDLLLREPMAIAVVHVAALAHATGIRPLELDGARPTLASFALGTYPAGIPLLLVTAGELRGIAATVVESARSGECVLAPDRILQQQ